MSKGTLRIYPLPGEAGFVMKEIEKAGCDERSFPIFAAKVRVLPVKIDSVPVAVANILKQEMLSAKGDAAIHREAITGKTDRSAVILLGTVSNYRDFLNKLAVQDYPTVRAVSAGLKDVIANAGGAPAGLTTRTGKTLDLTKPAIMGVLNVTEDSFSDGGKFIDPSAALAHAEEMAAAGAAIVDIGGESSRPGAAPVGEADELARVVPVVEKLAGRTKALLSVDTVKAAVAKAALDAGADIVNDISALRHDPAMAEAVAESGAHVVLMHMQGEPQTMQDDPRYGDVVGELIEFFDERMEFALDKGIERDKIMIDPGIGFGKTLAHNLEILAGLTAFGKYGLPVVVGASRKRMIGEILGGRPAGERLYGTLGAHMTAVLNGASIIRVHDVGEHRDMLDVVWKIKTNC